MAELRENVRDGERFRALSFASLPETWRAELDGARIMSRGKLLTYLNPGVPNQAGAYSGPGRAARKRVIDRTDLQQYLPFSETA
jgi:hypothetical protein